MQQSDDLASKVEELEMKLKEKEFSLSALEDEVGEYDRYFFFVHFFFFLFFVPFFLLFSFHVFLSPLTHSFQDGRKKYPKS